jgi:hypothetical protein
MLGICRKAVYGWNGTPAMPGERPFLPEFTVAGSVPAARPKSLKFFILNKFAQRNKRNDLILTL